MKQVIFSCALVALTANLFAQTYVSGGIFSNTTWSVANSPFIVTENIVVFQDVTLAIEPGVVIKFNNGKGMELRGKLIAIGTAANPIKFTSNSPTPAQSLWNGIKVIGNTDPLGVGNQVTMEYCHGESAHYFIDMDIAYHGPYTFKDCLFSNNYQTNYGGGLPSTIFENCRFESNQTALAYCQFESKVIRCSFINNVDGALGIKEVVSSYFSGNTGVALSPYGSTTDCTITNNNIGVSCLFNAVNNTFTNNVVSNNNMGVIMGTFFPNVNFTQNKICNNTTYNLQLGTSNNANLSNNCWCSTDSAYIRSTIHDGYSDLNLGLVNFMPFTTDCQMVSTEDIVENNTLTLNPNPTTGLITLQGLTEVKAVSVFDLTGKQLLQTTTNGNTQIEIDLSAYPAGMYFLRTDDGQAQKIIKQ